MGNLIESNLRQRVLGNTNPVKLGRCFEFLNNWYGFIQGTNQHSLSKVLTSSENPTPKNQTELAESYGITQQTIQNYKNSQNWFQNYKIGLKQEEKQPLWQSEGLILILYRDLFDVKEFVKSDFEIRKHDNL